MMTKLKWVLAGMAACALQGGTASDAAVPSQICERQKLSLNTRAWCDSFENAPDTLPKVCFRFKQPLSEETQRDCDRIRFADEPHYNVVRLARNGAVRSIHLIVTETGEEVVTAYPYGIAFAAAGDREVRLKTEDLEQLLEGRPPPADTRRPRAPTAPTGFATGLPIGWNNSTGLAPGQCLNYTIATPSNNVEQASFSSQDAASSTAEQINVSATVSGAFDFFHASDTASFSDQWQSSTNSSNEYYNFYSLYTLDSTVPPSNPLTSQGQNAGASFNTLCGSRYMASVPVGMVATISISYGSTSSSTQTSISDSFKVSFGLDSVSGAVGTAKRDTNSASHFTFSMVHYGGGPDAAKELASAFAATNSSGEAFYALCAAGDSDACTQFSSSMGSGATRALDSFNSLVDGLSSATNPDLSFFETFPNGVHGASTRTSVTSPIPPEPVVTSDVLAPFKSQVEQYVTLLNQIATLNNRVSLLSGLVSKPDFNPVSLLDLVGQLDRLDDVYKTDRSTLFTDLQRCLRATSSNVGSVCAPIIHNQATDAFEYYAADGAGDHFFAQQNTLALQYAGVFNPTGDPVPLAGIYIKELPSFEAAGSDIPIAGQSAFVGFADRPWIDTGGGLPEQFNGPLVAILALEPGEPLSTNNVSTKVRANSADPSPFIFWEIPADGDLVSSPPESSFTSVSCTPTFADPCAIDYDAIVFGDRVTVQNDQIEGLFD